MRQRLVRICYTIAMLLIGFTAGIAGCDSSRAPAAPGEQRVQQLVLIAEGPGIKVYEVPGLPYSVYVAVGAHQGCPVSISR